MERAKYLVECVESVVREWSIWDRSDSQGVHTATPFGKALAAMFDAFEVGDMPEVCRPIEKIVSRLAVPWQKYQEQVEATGRDDLNPPREFWVPFQELTAAVQKAKTPKYAKLPNARTLAAGPPVLNPDQIARQYEWKNEFGEYDANRVRAELVSPSPEFEDGVPDPREVEEQRKLDAQRIRMESSAQRQAVRAAASDPVAPESIELLCEQNVSEPQICRMKKITMDQLESYARENNVILPRNKGAARAAVDSVAAGVGDAGDQMADDDLDDYSQEGDTDAESPQALSTEQEICMEKERNPDITQEELGQMFGLHRKKIGVILRRRDEIMAGV